MGPPDRDIEWSEEGVRGAFRFVNRVWTLVATNADRVVGAPTSFDPEQLDEAGRSLWRRYQRTVKKVTEDIEGRFNFNTAISAIMELVNDTYRYVDDGGSDALLRAVIEGLILILSPFTPFVCEEMWRRIGHTNGDEDAVLDQAWPQFSESAIAEEQVEIPVQINGKVRVRVTVPMEIARDADALSEYVLGKEEVSSKLDGKKLVKAIAIPRKMVSLVVH
jgi:leucyl-tRNA synthetase